MLNCLKSILILVISLLCPCLAHGQVVQTGDTLHINYCFGLDAIGNRSKGFIIYHSETGPVAEFIMYDNSSDGISSDKELISNFYKANRNQYKVIKKWCLTDAQQEYIIKLIEDIKAYVPDKYTFSTGPIHFYITSNNENYICADHSGGLGYKEREMSENLGLYSDNWKKYRGNIFKRIWNWVIEGL